MDRALPAPRLALDGKRIAATSLAIVVHAVVLMLLLLPNVPPDVPVVEDPPMSVIPIREIKQPVPPKPPEPIPRPVTQRTAPTPVVIPDPPVVPIDDTVAPIDVYVPPVEDVVPSTFDTGPAASVFAQIAADVAPAPPYPPRAITQRLEGEVLLRVRVDARGEPVEVTIERSSGSRILDEAARKFVQARWHFVPATQDGRAIEALALVPIQYTLRQ